MFERLMTRLTFILFAMTVLMAVANNANANGIYISQVGDGADIEITQDGDNNRVSRKNDSVTSTPNSATFRGENQTMTLTQTGDDNFIGLYKHTYGSDTQTSSTVTGTQTGDDNIMRLDNHGDDNNITAEQYTHGSTMDIEIDYNNNDVVAKQYCHVGASCNADSMTMNIRGNNNDVQAGQGYKISSSGSWTVDNSEYGGHEMDLYINGDGNDVILSQRSNNNTSDHYMDVNINSDDNNVFVLQQQNQDKSLTLTINNDDNDVSINQQKSGGTQTATITLGGTYGTDLDLQMGTNNTSGPGSYSLTQDCQTVGGCTVNVTQN